MLHGDNDYTSNIEVEDLLRDDILLAHSFNGEPLTAKHGYPLRLVSSCICTFGKVLNGFRGFEVIDKIILAFGSKTAFILEEIRLKKSVFSGEDLGIPEDEWVHKDYD